MNAINKAYTSFVQKKRYLGEVSKSKLYVEKVEEGSIIIYLKEIITATLLPIVENLNPVLDFVANVKTVLSYFKLGEGEKPKLDVQECENLSRMFDVTAKDPKSKLTIEVIDSTNTNIHLHNCSFNFGESNGIQKQLEQEAEAIRENSTDDNTYSRVLMVIYQVRTDKESGKGNKAIVDDIAKGKKVPIVFDSDELRDKILYSETNPTQFAFQVDIAVQTINGTPIAYKITALHDTFPLEKEE